MRPGPVQSLKPDPARIRISITVGVRPRVVMVRNTVRVSSGLQLVVSGLGWILSTATKNAATLTGDDDRLELISWKRRLSEACNWHALVIVTGFFSMAASSASITEVPLDALFSPECCGVFGKLDIKLESGWLRNSRRAGNWSVPVTNKAFSLTTA